MSPVKTFFRYVVPITVNETVADPEMLEMVHSVSFPLSMNEDKLSLLYKGTANDPTLQLVTELQGKEECKYYYNLQKDIHVADGIVFLSHEIIVPDPGSLRLIVLKWVHKGHQGNEKTRARE
ncbi:hypothetical protein PR048_011993 [Dryococelus australis]|uniref:Uncharacterized protein n=1 Tax=Dryococelus australis TaxID=614101 RepID=A0ABQ9HN60_9NEOP|nr:hypothetical protein PR048_011993 [Dryococelus australis]